MGQEGKRAEVKGGKKVTGQRKTSRRRKYKRSKTGAGWGDKEEDRERKREEMRKN